MILYIKVSKNVMIFPSICVFTWFLIPTSYCNEEAVPDFCKTAYDYEEIHDAYNCSDVPSNQTANLANQVKELELLDATEVNFEVDLETEFDLHCCFYSQPYCPMIKWYKNGVEIKDELTKRKIDGGRTLKVHARPDSGGDYTCSATTPYRESGNYTIPVIVSRRCTGRYSVITSPAHGVVKVRKGSSQKLEWNFICFGKLNTAAVTCKRNDSVEITESDAYYTIARNRSKRPDNRAALQHTITILNVSRSENISCTTDDSRSPTTSFILVMEEEAVHAEPQRSFASENAAWIGTGISFIMLSSVVVLFLLWYKRRVSRREQIFYNRKEKEMKVRYDAFVSFSEDDGGSFVRSTLRPMLEDECGYTLSLHYRDFSPGATIVDNIINCMYNSRRTLVVVTPKFLESMWCKFEVNQGLRRAVNKPNTLIMVMPKEILLDRLPKSLRSFLSTVNYLLWDEGKREEMRKKLKRALGAPYTVKNIDEQNEIGVEISEEEKEADKDKLQQNGKKCSASIQVSLDNEAVNVV